MCKSSSHDTNVIIITANSSLSRRDTSNLIFKLDCIDIPAAPYSCSTDYYQNCRGFFFVEKGNIGYALFDETCVGLRHYVCVIF